MAMSDTEKSTTIQQRSALFRPSERPLVDRGGGARTIPMVSPDCGTIGVVNGYTMFQPGTKIPLHFHNCDESILIVEGAGLAVIDGVEQQVTAGDVTWVKAGVPHFFHNTSASETMKIFWIYTRTDATRTLVSSGEERPISGEHSKDKLVKA
jgi:putative monooxygenase